MQIYAPSQITKRIALKMSDLAESKIEEVLERYVQRTMEGRCISEGFMEPESAKLVRYSSGLLRGADIMFQAVIQCNLCQPFEGMLVRSVVRDITKAGVRAEAEDARVSPFVVFVAREHVHNADLMDRMHIGDTFVASVLGFRFEINDKFISVIADIAGAEKGEEEGEGGGEYYNK